MSSLQEKAAEAKSRMQTENPSVPYGKPEGERKRIPMSLPVQKLQIPEIPGYHLHWMRGDPQRIQQALNAGYVFVAPEEVSLNAVALGGDANKSGNSDLGDRVSVVSGDLDEQNKPVRLYLMKQLMEHYLADRQLLQATNDRVAEALTTAYRSGTVGGRAVGEETEDMNTRYVDKKRTRLPDFFKKKRPS